jgi:hypothetical protein
MIADSYIWIYSQSLSFFLSLEKYLEILMLNMGFISFVKAGIKRQ